MAASILDVPQVIDPQSLYVTTEAQKRLSMGSWAWRNFRRASNLKQTRIGSKCYVHGRDIIAAVDRLSTGNAAD